MLYNLPLNPLFLTADDWQLFYPHNIGPHAKGIDRAKAVARLNQRLAFAIRCDHWSTFLAIMRAAQHCYSHWGAADSEGNQVVDAYSRHYFKKETRYLY